MASLNGTYVLAPIVPPDDSRTYPTHIAEYGKGGLYSVTALTDRDAIPLERRTVGMLCFVQALGLTFQLLGGTSNTNWTEFSSGSGGSGSGGDMYKYVYDTNGDGKVDSANTADVALSANAVAWSNVTGKPTTIAPSAHTHPATDIVTDATHEFVTDVQIASWTAKVDASNVYTKTQTDAKIATIIGTAPAVLDTIQEIDNAINNDPNYATTMATALASKVDKVTGMGLSSNDYTAAEKTKLAGLTNYVAPSSYPATMIQTDMNHEFVTDAQIASWTAKQPALGYTPENLANKGVVNGYASLDATGKIPSSQLPSLTYQTGNVVTNSAARLALSGMKTGDLSFETSTGDTYIWNGSSWIKIADPNWANVNVSWSNLIGGPASAVTAIDNAVVNAHTHSNKVVLDATTESFTTAIKNSIGNATSILGYPVDFTGATNGYSLVYSNGSVKLAAIVGGSGSGTGDMLMSVYDTNANGIVDLAETANSVAWANVTGKPTSFPIAAHKSTHAIGGTDVLTPTDIGAADATTTSAHINNMSNPHNTTKAQIGLSNVTNDAQVKRTEMGVANGVATLDVSGKIPMAQLPALAVNNTYVVASQAAMLALSAVQGDVAIRTDVNKSFILQNTPASTLANWLELLAPTGTGIQSVNGQTGTSVTLTTSDVAEGTNLYYTEARVSANSTIVGHISNNNNPHNTTKAQIGLTNVTNDAQVKRTEMGVASGVATLGADGLVLSSQLPSGGGGGAVSSVNSKVGTVVLTTSDITESTNLYYTDVRVDARINANATVSSMSSHMSNTSNPHNVTKTQIGLSNVTNDAQVKRTEMAVANGIATLDATGKLVASQIPATVINNTFVVASQAAMLALSANQGDVAIRTDLSKSYVLSATPASTLINWVELLAPTGSAVQTVNGQSGPTVTLTTTNISEGTNLYYTDARVASSPALTAHTGNVSNPHSVTKTQVGLGNVDNVQQIPMSQKGVASGVATLGADGKVPSAQLPAASGGGTTISRYEATGSTGGQCLITATGTGVTFSIAGNAVTLAAPTGVEVLSARVFIPGASITANTATVDIGMAKGMGANDTYNDVYTPSMQLWKASSGSRTYFGGAAFNMNTATNLVSISGLTNGQDIWVKLVF